MSIDTLPPELFLEITSYIANREKFNLITCNRNLYELRHYLVFNEQVWLSEIVDSDLSFRNVYVDTDIEPMPLQIS